uniref:Uncharacterized protein n=1 Tax=Oryzias sinensis TaxID=183150 RepID=A0A8C7YDQ4_9TELE
MSDFKFSCRQTGSSAQSSFTQAALKMLLHGAFRILVVFVLFSCAVSSLRKGQRGSASHYDPWSGYSGGDPGSVGSSFMSAGGKSPDGSGWDAEAGRIVANAWRLRPDRPFPRLAWTSAHVPLGMVGERPVYPSSYVAKSNNGYQRVRDSSSDAKYSQDTFGHIPLPAPHERPGFKDRKI